MTFTNAHGEALFELLFQNDELANAYTDVGSGLLKAVTPDSLYISLHTADPGVDGTQLTSEATFGGYQRQAVTRVNTEWGITAGTSVNAPFVQNTNVITFPAATATNTPETITWAGIGTHGTLVAGNLLFRCPLALVTPRPFVAIDLVNEEFTADGHGLSTDDQVVFIDVEGEVLPTGITGGVVYYKMSTQADANLFRVSTSAGDVGPVNLTAVGSGLVAKVLAKTITENDVFEIAANKLTVYLR